ncbi:BZ3500_MvSof-1268-A1-R1_Chr6-3g08747 [Microbotryum saponariae]|uniref:BZ3500_MvSof-1268-A1-R1_Chr6-3g08747 protein n=1 Tax=Microbotryum saponariae TaxID=289078 RepID=A0A2X0LPN3_9BASI|nr:BZ3500_MvSof-1268-A1-R1_Chr6-3g08747 [Microbotryum saponariae]SDA07348.1 BZ3501_MvSof-1269-A2-R1_Chr6-2g08450 [Microbotryum saponariae]
MAFPAANLTTTEDLSQKMSPSIRVFKCNGGLRKDHFTLGRAYQRLPAAPPTTRPGPSLVFRDESDALRRLPPRSVGLNGAVQRWPTFGLPGRGRPTLPSDLSVPAERRLLLGGGSPHRRRDWRALAVALSTTIGIGILSFVLHAIDGTPSSEKLRCRTVLKRVEKYVSYIDHEVTDGVQHACSKELVAGFESFAVSARAAPPATSSLIFKLFPSLPWRAKGRLAISIVVKRSTAIAGSPAFGAVIHPPAGVSSRGLRGPREGSACAAQVATPILQHCTMLCFPHAGSRAALATHVPFWAFTALSTNRCVPHSQDYLPADEVADREFHLAGRSQLLAARYETLDVARLEPFAVLCTNRAPTVFIQCLAFVAQLPIVIPPTLPVYHQEVRTLFRLDQSLAVFPRRLGFHRLRYLFNNSYTTNVVLRLAATRTTIPLRLARVVRRVDTVAKQTAGKAAKSIRLRHKQSSVQSLVCMTYN